MASQVMARYSGRTMFGFLSFVAAMSTALVRSCNYFQPPTGGLVQPVGRCQKDYTSGTSLVYECINNDTRVTRTEYANSATCDDSAAGITTTEYSADDTDFKCDGDEQCYFCYRRYEDCGDDKVLQTEGCLVNDWCSWRSPSVPKSGDMCGGIAGIQCPTGYGCVDDPSDDCDPESGGADCAGICAQLVSVKMSCISQGKWTIVDYWGSDDCTAGGSQTVSEAGCYDNEWLGFGGRGELEVLESPCSEIPDAASSYQIPSSFVIVLFTFLFFYC